MIGMHKAFDELEALGWLDSKRRPRFVSVQAEGCAPVVRAFDKGLDHAPKWENAQTQASGLRVPGAVGDFLMLRALRESEGTAVAVSEQSLLDWTLKGSECEGICFAPEGGACIAAAAQLRESGWIREGERVVVFNTGTGVKYLEVMRQLLSLIHI